MWLAVALWERDGLPAAGLAFFTVVASIFLSGADAIHSTARGRRCTVLASVCPQQSEADFISTGNMGVSASWHPGRRAARNALQSFLSKNLLETMADSRIRLSRRGNVWLVAI